MRWLCALALLVAWSSPLAAQTGTSSGVARAEQLRADGDFAEAARVLRAELARDPDHLEAARLLAQTLYWLGRPREAALVYDDARRRHPQDPWLQLDYARMLAATHERQHAQRMAWPLQAVPAVQAEADTLLGTIAYWEGDLSAARRHFERALTTHPAQADALRQLDEIRAVTRPSIQAGVTGRADDQPLQRVSPGVEARWFLTPLVPVTLRVDASRFTVGGRVRRVTDAEVSVAGYAPDARLETELAAGLMQHVDDTGASITGRAAVGLRVLPHLTVRTRLQRAPYRYTRTSLETPVHSDSARASAHWGQVSGWLGEAAADVHRYPDGNDVRSAYVWQLVPLLRTATARLQVGYAFAMADSSDSRFALITPVQAVPPGHVLFDTSGRYDPYFTPAQARSHAAIAAASVTRPTGTTITLGASFGVRATQLAPAIQIVDAHPRTVFTPRTLNPWTVRAAAEIRISRQVTALASAEAGRTTFYRWITSGLQVVYHFESAR